jgi:hypothetical protein
MAALKSPLFTAAGLFPGGRRTRLMSKPFDPRRILKHTDNALLREYVARRGELAEIKWDELPEHGTEPVFLAIQALPDDKRGEVYLILRDIGDLADAPHACEFCSAIC